MEMKSEPEHTSIVVLHNVRSAENVGSIFRTADAAGVKEVYLTGYTPTPIDRFGRSRRDIKKTALGAEEALTWRYEEDVTHVLHTLRSNGFEIIAVEQHPRAISYRTEDTSSKQAFVFGNEVEGLPESVIEDVDVIVEIPMHGTKESLNVAVAAGIILFKFLEN